MTSLDTDTILRGERLTLRTPRDGDAEALTAILAEPEVMRWWGTNDLASVRDDLAAGFVIVIDDAPAGWVLYTEETAPGYMYVGFDITLTTSAQGQGYGREALRLAIRHFVSRGHHRFTIDPAVHNERAIRCYTAVGFKPVGVMRDYERIDDGPWHDALLMDLLAHELVG
ncbi:MAG: family N-acetyltransferase [Actinomycetia bacterium]|jgi:aminoglycoside 6'-N-acetyltransferase|nr:family N-acetyltransferase [Actinomycetes bacterium]